MTRGRRKYGSLSEILKHRTLDNLYEVRKKSVACNDTVCVEAIDREIERRNIPTIKE